jgi:biotin operon repressor
MAKLPALQFYPGDWKKDIGVQSLSMHDRGVWLEMLFLMHDSTRRGVLLLGDKPMPVEVLARLLGLTKESISETIDHLVSYGVTERESRTGALINRRMLREETKRADERGRLSKWRKAKKTNEERNGPETVDETDLKRLSSSSSSTTTAVLDDDAIDASMAVSGLIQLTGIHTQEARIVLDRMAQKAEKGHEDLKAWVDKMVQAWKLLESSRPKLKYAWGAERFFGEGHYKDPHGWPWKEGYSPPAANGNGKKYWKAGD